MARSLAAVSLAAMLVTMAALLPGCASEPRYPAALAVADSLADHGEALRAVALLDSLRATLDAAPRAASPAVCARLDLLTVKARDKAYLPITDDSLMMAAYDYYTMQAPSAVLRRHKPELCYYMGRTRFELGDYPRALDFFQQSLAAITAAHADSLRLRSQVYSNMGAIYRRIGDNSHAIECFKSAVNCDTALRDTVFLIYDYGHLGEADSDSTLYYYSKIRLLAKEMGDTVMIKMTDNHFAILLVANRKYDKARHYLQELTHPAYNDSAVSYLYAGKIYMHYGKSDSAEYYFHRSIETDGNVYIKRRAYQHLAEIKLSENNPRDAMKFARCYETLSDSINVLSSSEEIHKMQAMYNYSLREKENARLKDESEKKDRYILWGVILFIVSVSTMMLLLQKQMSRRALAEKQCRIYELYKDDTNRRIATDEVRINQLLQEISTLSDNNVTLSKQLHELQSAAEERQQAEAKESHLRSRLRLEIPNSAFYKHIVSQTDQGKKLTPEEWNEVSAFINRLYPEFITKLQNLSTFSSEELKLCYLVKLQIPLKNAAAALCKTKSAMTHMRERLILRCTGEKVRGDEWDKFIESL